MPIDETSIEIMNDCVRRISDSDVCATFDLASIFMAHADSRSIELNLKIIEGLATVAKVYGCPEAAKFLGEEWGALQEIFKKRWARAGYS